MIINEYNKGVREIHYDITMSCNNRCPYCYVLEELDNNKIYDEKTTSTVINKINKYIKNNSEFSYNFFIKGGEPLLVIDKVIDFYDRLKKINMFSIFTNLNFSKNVFLKKLDYIKKRNIIILISWHQSSNENHIKTNLKILKENNIETEVLLFLDKDNIENIYKISQWCLQNGFTYVVNSIKINHQDVFGGFDTDIYKTLKNNSQVKDIDTICDSYGKLLQCELFSAYISYDGSISSNCGYKITKLEDMKPVVCFNKDCGCNYDNYKEIIRVLN